VWRYVVAVDLLFLLTFVYTWGKPDTGVVALGGEGGLVAGNARGGIETRHFNLIYTLLACCLLLVCARQAITGVQWGIVLVQLDRFPELDLRGARRW
jgi:hypothetical protein